MSVNVKHQARQAKIKYTPGTLLGEIKSNACNFFKLNPENYSLKHNSTILDLSLPFRLSNLVSNAKLELVPAKISSSVKNVRIKIHVVDLPPNYSAKLVHEFPNNSLLIDILKHFERTSGINFTQRGIPEKKESGSGRLLYELPTLQLFNKVTSKIEDLEQSLVSLGIIEGSELIRVRFESSEIPFEKAIAFVESIGASNDQEVIKKVEIVTPVNDNRSSKDTVKQLQASDSNTVEEMTYDNSTGSASEPASEPKENSALTEEFTRSPTVYIMESGYRQIPMDETDNLEMNANQFTQYQAHLKSIYNNERPLMTKAMRERMELEKKASIKTCIIRIRLPGNEFLEGTFKSEETISDIYEYVRSSLKDEVKHADFTLLSSSSRKVLADLHQTLVSDCGFGHRELFYFKWVGGTVEDAHSVLKSDLALNAKSISESPSVKLDEELAPSSASTSEGSNIVTKPKINGGSEKKMPKWMKLSKK